VVFKDFKRKDKLLFYSPKAVPAMMSSWTECPASANDWIGEGGGSAAAVQRLKNPFALGDGGTAKVVDPLLLKKEGTSGDDGERLGPGVDAGVASSPTPSGNAVLYSLKELSYDSKRDNERKRYFVNLV